MRRATVASSKRLTDDLRAFREEMADVRPLRTEPRAEPSRQRPPPRPRQREADERRVLQELLLEPETDPDLATGEELQWLRSGYQRRYLTRLRRGHYAVGDHLDLHHMNESAARASLLDFIDHALERGHGCVRVVHGKGLRSKTYPKLKAMTNRLLRRHKAVVAFASCRPADGGTGAVLVLLRDRRKGEGRSGKGEAGR